MSDFESTFEYGFENYLESLVLGEFTSVRGLVLRGEDYLDQLLCFSLEDEFVSASWVGCGEGLGEFFEYPGDSGPLPGQVPLSLAEDPEAVDRARRALIRVCRWGLEYCRLGNEEGARTSRFQRGFAPLMGSVLVVAVDQPGVEEAERLADQLAGVFFFSVSSPQTSEQFRLLVDRVQRVPSAS